MAHTTQQLQAMSDSEINVALELKLNKGAEFVGSHYVETGDGVYPNVIKHKSWPNYRECTDYCNNPNDIMPLAFERNVSIVQSEADRKHGQWCAFLWHTEDEFNDENPLRAIACLILLMD